DGTHCYEPQNEQNIVISPTNHQNIVTSANDYRYGFQALIYYSTDGGKTFSDVLLPGWDPATGATGLFKHVQAGGDPVLAFAPDGTLYYSALVYDFSYPNRTPSGVAVAASHDGGATWGAPVMVHYDAANNFFNDKEWIAAGAGGDVTRDQIVLARSTDGGHTFTNVELGRVYDDVGCYPLNVAQGRQRLSFEQFRINGFPSLAIDPTTGGLAIAWADDQNNAGCANGATKFSGVTSNQVKLITSGDGTTWTAPRQITSGANDKVYPAVGANDGRVAVGY